MRLVLAAVLLGYCLAVPTDQHTSSKDMEQKQPDLSNQQHYSPEREHNPQYDHEAFLGEEQAHEFTKLTPAESKRRLGVIADKVDTNKDGIISKQELMVWITHIARRHVAEEVEKQWSTFDQDGDGYITWEEFNDRRYGMIGKDRYHWNDIFDTNRQLTFQGAKDRDERRFKAADQDKDGKHTKDEYGVYIRPENVPYMKDIVIEETMEDMDKDQDGYITVEEYIDNVWPESERKKNPEEPSYVQSEKDQFRDYRDKDKDGKLNKEELGKWIIPQDYDPIEAEAAHLIYEADSNQDKQLSKEEMIENYEVFVGSQATNYGQYMNKHDEF
ncbi:calumenin-like [Dysidea avara]|uniref:calumenin-like n=1 Tax=Dysidea avara TaxID=196820 RepID=UPI00332D6F15